jgi:tetraacyldisaccharide 4'-kinase
VPVSEPRWWYEAGGTWKASLLSPIAAIVGAIARRRILNAKPYRSPLPVICVGNFTAGGSGKTPLALLLANIIAAEGREPWFLSRGYGGKLEGPLRVDPEHHSAGDVGDEPLLLARAFPAVIARDRRQGAKMIEAMASANAVIIMDDGLQNPALAKELSIAVVDAKRGFGNGRVIPAGPLRAPLAVQAPLVQLVMLMSGAADADNPAVRMIRKLTEVPIIAARTQADETAARFRGRRVVAFAGIANPERFFSTLEQTGANIVAKRAFADHHPFSEAEARGLLDDAERLGAMLVTTEKDHARIGGRSGFCADLKKRSETLAIATVIEGDGLEILQQSLRAALGR